MLVSFDKDGAVVCNKQRHHFLVFAVLGSKAAECDACSECTFIAAAAQRQYDSGNDVVELIRFESLDNSVATTTIDD